MASAAARLLFLCEFPVVVLEREQPLAVRRLVAFAEAVFAGECVVEGVTGRLCPATALGAARLDHVPVAVDPQATCLGALRPGLVVDARMAKRAPGPLPLADVPLVGLGPGFCIGANAAAVVETQRGPDLGRVLWSGSPLADTGVPAPILGEGARRVVRAPCAGVFRARVSIGALVEPGTLLGTVAEQPVCAAVAGRLRGIVADGVSVGPAVKLGDVDPRGAAVDPAVISDKARAVAAGVLEAVAVLLARR
jgi:xanthine dehydrogenase accessory factor